mmetsp:Transcript_107871/g.287200  ORF Transcript_107871/g.287200 Transcript_107871/m.287200 type:complete len:242 (-) Transcript_107871:544-1269(-)
MFRRTAGPKQHGLHALVPGLPADDEAVQRGARLPLLHGPVPRAVQLAARHGPRVDRRSHGAHHPRGAGLLHHWLRDPGGEHALREPEAHAPEPLPFVHGAQAGCPDVRDAPLAPRAAGAARAAARTACLVAGTPRGADAAVLGRLGAVSVAAPRQRLPCIRHERCSCSLHQAELRHHLHPRWRCHEGRCHCGCGCHGLGGAAQPVAGCWLHNAARCNPGMVWAEGCPAGLQLSQRACPEGP